MRKVIKQLLYVSAGILLCSSGIFAQGNRGNKERPSPEMIIKKLDQNEDNKLSKEESKDARFYRDFDKIDTNSDGYLTSEELNAFFESRRKEQKN